MVSKVSLPTRVLSLSPSCCIFYFKTVYWFDRLPPVHTLPHRTP